MHGGAIPAERLSETGTVRLDAGTTTGALAAVFPTDRELRVVTIAVTIAVALAIQPNVEVHLVGGRVRSRTMASVGARAVADLEDLLVDVAFVLAKGVSHNRGLTTADPSEATVKRAMVLSGRRVTHVDGSSVVDAPPARQSRSVSPEARCTRRDSARSSVGSSATTVTLLRARVIPV